MGELLRCHVCNEEQDRGIVILDHYICKSCEAKMIDESISQEQYEIMKNKIKEIFKATV